LFPSVRDIMSRWRWFILVLSVLVGGLAVASSAALLSFRVWLDPVLEQVERTTGWSVAVATLDWQVTGSALEITGHGVTARRAGQAVEVGTLGVRLAPLAWWTGQHGLVDAVDALVIEDVTVALPDASPADPPEHAGRMMDDVRTVLATWPTVLDQLPVQGIIGRRIQVAWPESAGLPRLHVEQLEARVRYSHASTTHDPRGVPRIHLDASLGTTWQQHPVTVYLTSILHADGTVDATVDVKPVAWSALGQTVPGSSSSLPAGSLHPVVRIHYTAAGAVVLHASLDWHRPGQEERSMTLAGQRNPEGVWRGDLQWSALQLSELAPLLAAWPPLDGLNFPLTGSAQASWNEQQPESFLVQWQAVAGSGSVHWPALFRWPLPVTQATAHGRFQCGQDRGECLLAVEQFRLSSTHGEGEGALDITRLTHPDGPEMVLHATATGVSTEHARFYYPHTVMPPELVQWLDGSLHNGRVKKATVQIRGPLSEALFLDAAAARAKGWIFRVESDVEGVDLRYFAPLHPIQRINTHMVFDRLSMSAQVTQATMATSRDLRGTVRIVDMTRPVVEIEAQGSGELQGIWRDIVAHPALGWDRSAGLAGSQIAGQARYALRVALNIDHLARSTYDGRIDFQRGRLDLPSLPYPLEQLEGRLTVDPDQIRVQTHAGRMADLPMTAKLTASTARGNKASALDLRTTWTLHADRLSTWLSPLLATPVTGDGETILHLHLGRKPGQSGLTAAWQARVRDLHAAGYLGWRLAGEPGILRGTGMLQPDGTLHRVAMTGRLGNLSFSGQGIGDLDSRQGEVILRPFRLGDTHGALQVRYTPDLEPRPTWTVRASLEALDLRTLLFERPPEELDRIVQRSTALTQWPRTDIRIHASKAPMAHQQVARELVFHAATTPQEIRFQRISFLLGEQQGMVLENGDFVWERRTGQGPYHANLRLTSADIGRLCQALNLYDGFVEGDGTLTATLLGYLPDGARLADHLTGYGTLDAKNGVMLRMGFLAQLLGLFSLGDLPGLLMGDRPDLSGDGVYYHTWRMPFVMRDSRIRVDAGALTGPSMKIVWSGHADLPQNKTEMLVGIRPFQNIDAIINQIPLLGAMIAGSRKTIIEYQFDVTGKLSDPDIMLKPINSLAFGILKDILQLPEYLLRQLRQTEQEAEPP
jgi:hypothetical protein